MTSVAAESPRLPELTALLTASDDFAFSLYPADSCYLLDVTDLEKPGVTFFAARIEDDAVGIAALVRRGDGTAEIKRMFVADAARGNGVASALLAVLEGTAVAEGLHLLQLETGPKQPAAVALYEKHGFTIIPNFGPYVGDQFSICMEKPLVPAATPATS